MRTSHVICDDIRDDKRLRKVFCTVRNYGEHLQYSVFERNSRMATPKEFGRRGPEVALTANAGKAFFWAYGSRTDTLATHPLFEYRLSYRRRWSSSRGCL